MRMNQDERKFDFHSLVLFCRGQALEPFLHMTKKETKKQILLCQCPLGLIPHFYYAGRYGDDHIEKLCQCPLGLIPHFYGTPSKT